ncbi:MAG: rod shape-determining protein RodA [Pseudomonadota bacterium]
MIEMGDFSGQELSLSDKIRQVHWGMILLLCLIASIAIAMLYSAGGASFTPWAGRQAVRFAVGMMVLFVVGLTDIRFWLRHAYTLYGASLVFLIAVEFAGAIGMGAQRWLDLGYVQFQPSEVMKIAIILALARYFHGASLEDVSRPAFLAAPFLLLALPGLLVLRQPDLGTAVTLATGGLSIFFLAGVRVWKFVSLIGIGLVAMPLLWMGLHGYQRRRVLIFLDPESDPLGAGYHILQSQIALGSGGLFGKGFLQGTQAHLNFLPEKQTDFIFTMLAEEFGLAGSLILLTLYLLLAFCGVTISLRSRNQFGRLLGMGITVTFALYFFINIAMVTGLIPVVGVPLPFISYGGTAMLTLLFAFGLIMSVHIHRDLRMSRRGSIENL